MRKSIIVFLLISALYPVFVFAQDPGMPDSVIFGNLDGSPIYSDGSVNLPVWFKNDEDLNAIGLFVGIDRNYGHLLDRILYYPLNSWICSDSIYAQSPFPEFPSFQFIRLILWSEGFPVQPLFTDTHWQQIMTIRFGIESDSSLIGDTTCIAAFWPGITSVQSGCIIVGSPLATDDYSVSPSAFFLSQNYPNPFNAQTTISYTLPAASDVTIDIFDILGRKISTLTQGSQPAGSHSAIWDASDAASGIYFYRINANGHKETRQMLLLR